MEGGRDFVFLYLGLDIDCIVVSRVGNEEGYSYIFGRFFYFFDIGVGRREFLCVCVYLYRRVYIWGFV